MFSTYFPASSENFRNKGIKTLRNVLLERSVVNFNKIFLDQSTQSGTKNGILLPPYLFEDIQLKSNEMWWPISHDYLKVCLSIREALNWVNIDLKCGVLEKRDLIKIIETDLPVRQLSFRTGFVTYSMENVIEKISPNLEILEIFYDDSSKDDVPWYNSISYTAPKSIQFSKMKQFFIDLSAITPNFLQGLDIKSCSQSMKCVGLKDSSNSFKDDQSFRDFFLTLRRHTNLETLSYSVKFSVIYTYIGHFTTLRTLDMTKPTDYILYIPEAIGLVNLLPSLENLTLSSRLLKKELAHLKNRKLNYVGCYEDFAGGRPYANKYGSTSNVESILNIFDHCCNPADYLELLGNGSIIHRFLHIDQSIEGSEWKKCEKVVLMMIRWLRHDNSSRNMNLSHVIKFNSNRWSRDFLMNLAHVVVSRSIHERNSTSMEAHKMWFVNLIEFQQLKSYMLDFITSHPASTISMTYLKYLLISKAISVSGLTEAIKKMKILEKFEITSLKFNKI